jgi:hypothetical protein
MNAFSEPDICRGREGLMYLSAPGNSAANVSSSDGPSMEEHI